jgi:hypothetical protein
MPKCGAAIKFFNIFPTLSHKSSSPCQSNRICSLLRHNCTEKLKRSGYNRFRHFNDKQADRVMRDFALFAVAFNPEKLYQKKQDNEKKPAKAKNMLHFTGFYSTFSTKETSIRENKNFIETAHTMCGLRIKRKLTHFETFSLFR